MKKLLLGLFVSSLVFGSMLIGKEGIEVYNKARDRALIVKCMAEEKAEFSDFASVTDYDSESPVMHFSAEQKQAARAELEKQLPKEMHNQIDEFLKQMESVKIDKQKLYTYCIDNKPVAFIRMLMVQGVGMISELAVVKEYRRKGIAGKLLKQAVAELKKLKVVAIVAQVSSTNAIAQKLYTKVGFVKQGVKEGRIGYVLQLAPVAPAK